MSKVESKANQLAGVVGFFSGPEVLVEAMKKVKDARYESFDAFTPYPIHGMDQAQGLKRSVLPFFTFAAGLTGGSLGFLLEYWTSAVSWPINVGGKPFNSWPAFIPVTFELTILFAGLATAFGMFIINRLPNLNKRSFDPGITSNRFALIIEAPVEKTGWFAQESRAQSQYKPFQEKEAQDFLKSIGASEVRSVNSEGWF